MSLVISDLAVTYRDQAGHEVEALQKVNLEFDEHEFIMIIGPSGCGKSTLLHAVGGLLKPTEGSVSLGGSPVVSADPNRLAFVFQDYSLLPWKKVIDNIGIGLQFMGVPKRERYERAMKLLELMDLVDFANKYPYQLSGGMQQRAAVARALVMEPTMLLMDEPFGALDEMSRRRLGVEMSRLLTEQRKGLVAVTHSLDEAIFWADRILVMSPRPGRILEDIRVPRPRPRDTDFLTDPMFSEIRTGLLKLLEDQKSADDDARRIGAVSTEV